MYVVQVETRREQPTAVTEATVPAEDIGARLSGMYSMVAAVITAGGGFPAGPPFARYHRLEDGRLASEAGFPVSRPIGGSGPVRDSSTLQRGLMWHRS